MSTFDTLHFPHISRSHHYRYHPQFHFDDKHPPTTTRPTMVIMVVIADDRCCTMMVMVMVADDLCCAAAVVVVVVMVILHGLIRKVFAALVVTATVYLSLPLSFLLILLPTSLPSLDHDLLRRH